MENEGKLHKNRRNKWFSGQPEQLQIAEENINIAKSTKVLGITLDDKLNFD